jgi:hypothetical protein
LHEQSNGTRAATFIIYHLEKPEISDCFVDVRRHDENPLHAGTPDNRIGHIRDQSGQLFTSKWMTLHIYSFGTAISV